MFIDPSTVSFAAVTCSFVFLGCTGSALKAPQAPSADPTTAHEDKPSAAASPLAESARALAGTWRCTGAVHGPNGPSPSEVTLATELDLDEAWLRARFVVTSGEYRYKFDSYRTFDSSSSQWVNVIVDNLRGHTISSSADGVTWTGASSGPMGAMQIKDTETLVSPGEMNLLGQYSLDGTSWNTGYELLCKR